MRLSGGLPSHGNNVRTVAESFFCNLDTNQASDAASLWNYFKFEEGIMDGGLAGILTVDDLIDLFSEQLGDLARLIALEQKREKERRK